VNLYEKLLKIQSELRAPKGQYNDFGNYYYRSCEDIQEGVKPLLKEVGAVLLIGDEIVQLGDRYYIKATASLIDCESGDKIENVAYAREEFNKPKMDASQVTGSASSYARKYALNGLFCIDDVKDPDTGKNENKTEKKTDNRADSKTTGRDFTKHDELVGLFHKEIQRTGKSLKWFLDNSKVSDAKYIKTADLNKYIEILKALPDKG
jgi:hypothetical protein